MKKKLYRVFLCSILILLLTGCGSKNVLTVSVAASLADCMEDIKIAFQKKYPNIQLQINSGASGTLQQQIEQGAPVDLFFSAGSKQMDALEAKGFIEKNSRANLVRNELVLIVPKHSQKQITFDNLQTASIKQLAVGELESVPAGQYAFETFKTLGISEDIKKKCVYGKDVREVLSWVATGNVDAGIVYKTDTKISEKVRISDVAGESLHTPIIYPIAIIKDTLHSKEAYSLLAFFKTQEVRDIFKQHGFTPIF